MVGEGRNKKALCAEDLRRRILTQDLAPGAYLDEAEVSAAYGLSRPPLREILRELAGEGYVVLTENRGAQVAPMTHKTLRNFFMAAPMIYAAVARLAAEHATSAGILRLKEAQRSFREAIQSGDPARRALGNERFHALMGEMADNEYLTASLRRILIDHTRIGMTFYDPRRTGLAREQEIAADQHDAFIALIEAGDGEGAAALAEAHWELSRAQIEEFVTPAAIRAPLGVKPEARRV